MSKPKAPPPDPYLEAQKKKAMEEETRRIEEENFRNKEEKIARGLGLRGAASLLSGGYKGFSV